MSHLQELNDYLNRHVPLFRAMQAQIERCDVTRLALTAPLEPNVNDKGTAFGGSMAAIAALTGWTMTTLTPVSYTHLDVYKRQPGHCPNSARPCSCRRLARPVDSAIGPVTDPVR